MNSKIIVVATEHHNTLGIIRSLGMCGYVDNTTLILLSDPSIKQTEYSKYIKNTVYCECDEETLMSLLLSMKDEQEKGIIVPECDLAEEWIDKNLNMLKDWFICPNINDTQGNVCYYMKKNNQYNFVKQLGFGVAETWDFSLEKDNDFKKVTFPCIVKPLASTDGDKLDIAICTDIEMLLNVCCELKKKNYDRIIVQQYLDVKQEYVICGCIHNEQIYAPSVFEKIKIFPARKGNTACGIAMSTSDSKEILNMVIPIIRKFGYSGVFDVEIIECANGNYYWNEMNFRNSGVSFALTKVDIHIIPIWIELITKGVTTINHNVDMEYFFYDENLCIKSMLAKEMSVVEFAKHLKNKHIGLYYTIKDVKPSVCKFVSAFKSLVTKNR